MPQPIKVLLIEDQEDDAQLVLRFLRKSGYHPYSKRIDSSDALRATLKNDTWELILSDFNMPGFNVQGALSIMRELHRDIPFIVVSGAIGEETAVQLMKSGAHDYVLKSNLARLIPAIERELKEAQIRYAQKDQEEKQKFLTEISTLLGASLDLKTTLQHLIHSLTPRIAQWASVEFDPNASPDIQIVVDKNISRLSEDEIIVPLTVRGRTLGALVLRGAPPHRKFASSDLKLAEEVGYRAAFAIDNSSLYQKAQESIQLREDFLSIASHEFRTPLTSLKIQTQVMLRKLDAGNKANLEEIKSGLHKVNSQIDRLNSLVDALLDTTNIEANRFPFHFQNVNLSNLVQEMVDEIIKKNKTQHIPIEIHAIPNLFAHCDPDRIKQVVSSLLSNAMKYGENHLIQVSVDRISDSVRITVEDHGIGIEKNKISKIFERFERAVSPDNISGLGLGLYISQKIISKHGGRISVDSEPRRGSKFTVEIPIHSLIN